MTYTLGEAAKATGLTKPTIAKAIKSGKISATKNDNGSYTIDPAELHRVYPPIPLISKPSVNTLPFDTPDLPHDLPSVLLEIERLERDRERQQLNETINDLRKRLDEATEAQREAAAEIRKLTLMLTHVPTTEPQESGSTALLDRIFKRGKPTTWHR
jgi:excisionase family DNA binding protein